tara:strand:- start:235 stop:690 length:456 start_codon:yes stop_codon:yes gene_type:complete
MGGGSNRAGELVSPDFSEDIAAIPVGISVRDDAPVAILTGAYGAKVLSPLIDSLGRGGIRIVEVENLFFGGNVKVSGLMVGEDLRRTLSSEPEGHRYLLPDVCLNNGKFLDGLRIDDLPREVEVVPTDGVALRAALKRGIRSEGLPQEGAM